MNTTRTRIILALTALLSVTSAHADEVVLLNSVRLEAGADVVTLGDIAELEGPEATKFADLPIVELSDSTPVIEIAISTVRDALNEAGAHRGRLNLNGRSVVVRARNGLAAAAPGAMRGASLTKSPRRSEARQPAERGAASMVNATTLGGRVARDVVRAFGTRPEAVRFVFDQRDVTFLDRPEDGVQFEIVPESSLRTDRVRLTVRVWSDGIIESTRSITFRPLIHRATVIAGRDLSRGHTLDADDLAVQTRWRPPSQCHGPERIEALLGRTMMRTVRTGDVINEKHARRRTVVERGDRVQVRCLVGGVVISMKAQAREDGAVGDTIELQKLGERDTFLATVVERGEAVVQLSRRGAPPARPTPSPETPS